MYQHFYGLRELPFDLSPDPRYLYLTARHSEALANLQYGISASKGLTLLIGEAGTGKTTLVRAALESKACRSARALYLNNPTLTRGEFLEFLGDGFSLGNDAATSKASLLKRVSQNCSNLAIQDIKTVGCGIALTAKLQQFVRYQPLNSGFNDGRQHVTDECCG